MIKNYEEVVTAIELCGFERDSSENLLKLIEKMGGPEAFKEITGVTVEM